jgi:hypothetical protein
MNLIVCGDPYYHLLDAGLGLLVVRDRLDLYRRDELVHAVGGYQVEGTCVVDRDKTDTCSLVRYELARAYQMIRDLFELCPVNCYKPYHLVLSLEALPTRSSVTSFYGTKMVSSVGVHVHMAVEKILCLKWEGCATRHGTLVASV